MKNENAWRAMMESFFSAVKGVGVGVLALVIVPQQFCKFR